MRAKDRLSVEDLAKVAWLRSVWRTPGLLRSLRVAGGLTQKEVARTCKIGGHSTVARWESGQREPHGAGIVAYSDLIRRLMGQQ